MKKFTYILSGLMLFQKVGKMKHMKIAFLTVLFFTLFLNISNAATIWSSTFNCSSWTEGQSLNCDSLAAYGGWTCNGQGAQITSAANYSGGGGGLGLRRFEGDGDNVVSGSTQIYFAAQNEIWVRWYMRYQSGFKWGAPAGLDYDKVLYFDNSVVAEFHSWNSVNIFTTQGNHDSSGGGWDTVMANGGNDGAGHKTSDGQWHYYEVHLKRETSGSNGVGEFWVDGVKYLSNSSITYGTTFSYVIFGVNENSPSNGGCRYVDYDDIVVATTGPIGPIGGGTPPPVAAAPAAPVGLMVQ